MSDSNLRPRGTVERECSLCHWRSWHDPLSAEATGLIFVCENCKLNPFVATRCTACNRYFTAKHRNLTEMHPHYRCSDCVGVAAGAFASVVYCWSCGISGGPESTGKVVIATKQRGWNGTDDVYHLCGACDDSWDYDIQFTEAESAEYTALFERRQALQAAVTERQLRGVDTKDLEQKVDEVFSKETRARATRLKRKRGMS